MENLTQQKCAPCAGAGKPLAEQKIRDYLKELDHWQLDKSGKIIVRDYTLKNFMAGINFMSRVAEIAEQENHHPDLHLTGYRKLRIELSTHAAGGLTENDFILAARINQLPVELK